MVRSPPRRDSALTTITSTLAPGSIRCSQACVQDGQAVHLRHLDVESEKIGLQVPDLLHGNPAVGCASHHLDAGKRWPAHRPAAAGRGPHRRPPEPSRLSSLLFIRHRLYGRSSSPSTAVRSSSAARRSPLRKTPTQLLHLHAMQIRRCGLQSAGLHGDGVGYAIHQQPHRLAFPVGDQDAALGPDLDRSQAQPHAQIDDGDDAAAQIANAGHIVRQRDGPA